MKVLMLSTDKHALDPGSATGKRLAGYASFATIKVLLVTKNIFKTLREGKKIINDFKPDVVSAQDPFFVGWVGLILARVAHAPLQIQIHTDFMNPAYIFESWRHIVESLIARIVLPRASCVRAVSERIAKDAQKFTKAPVSVLPIRVQGPPTAPRAPSSPPLFITVSRLTHEKRIHLVIDALAHVPGATLAVIGDGPLRARLEARARNRGVMDRVHFLGWVDDLAPHYQRATALVQMSRYEGYGMAVMEAALAGCPIITTDVGVVGDVLPRDDVRIVTDVQSLTTAMRGAIDSPRIPRPPRVLSEAEYYKAYATALTTCLP